MPRVKKLIQQEIEDDIRSLPGYDPYRDSEGYEFDWQAANKVVGFFNKLRHCKGPMAGKPFKLLKWQRAVVSNLFGWKDYEGHLRYRECLIYVGKKNGKSAFAAGIILYLLTESEELGQEIYGAASSTTQAGNVFSHVKGMIALSPDLKKLEKEKVIRLYGGHGGNSVKSVRNQVTHSDYICIAADSGTCDGTNVSGAIIDELHRFYTARHHEFCDVMEKSTAARHNALIIYTTTADYARESVCNTIRERAIKIRDGILEDPRFLPVIYECSRDCDWEDESEWPKANPSLGVTVPIDFLRREAKKAKEIAAHRNGFLRLHLNILTQSDEAWLDMDAWDRAHKNFTEEWLEKKPCIAGLDLASVQDLTALVLLFYVSGHYYCLPYFWAPKDTIGIREQQAGIPYSVWAKEGLIELTPGPAIDYNIVQARILELRNKFNIQCLAADPSNALQLLTNLDAQGMDVWKFTQTFPNYHPAVGELEARIMARTFHHDGNPVLRWMASNVCLDEEMTTGRRRPSKRRSSEKIDGIVALLMAIGRHMASAEKKPSVYSRRGLLQ